ncbi:hypothetical protein ACP70R_021022 [Stipagrostis hirtigluma subsp. patula]
MKRAARLRPRARALLAVAVAAAAVLIVYRLAQSGGGGGGGSVATDADAAAVSGAHDGDLIEEVASEEAHGGEQRGKMTRRRGGGGGGVGVGRPAWNVNPHTRRSRTPPPAPPSNAQVSR